MKKILAIICFITTFGFSIAAYFLQIQDSKDTSDKSRDICDAESNYKKDEKCTFYDGDLCINGIYNGEKCVPKEEQPKKLAILLLLMAVVSLISAFRLSKKHSSDVLTQLKVSL